MIRRLPAAILKIRSQYYRLIREFFYSRGLIEAETPLMNPSGSFEPFIDPVKIERNFIKKSPGHGDYPAYFQKESFLITSPEYNLKTILPDAEKGLFQIAHCFREGDTGSHHSVEFLMLEWYRKGADLASLISETFDLIEFLRINLKAGFPFVTGTPAEGNTVTVTELFSRFCPDGGFEGGITKENLVSYVRKLKLHGPGEEPEKLRYDELFFTVFLNRVEPCFITDQPFAVTGYPPELRANARLIKNASGNPEAARFEIYWKGIELANGYLEITDPEEQRKVFEEDNRIRKSLGKEEMKVHPQLLASLAELHLQDFPVSGIALGLDRLLMVLTQSSSLQEISPFY